MAALLSILGGVCTIAYYWSRIRGGRARTNRRAQAIAYRRSQHRRASQPSTKPSKDDLRLGPEAAE